MASISWRGLANLQNGCKGVGEASPCRATGGCQWQREVAPKPAMLPRLPLLGGLTGGIPPPPFPRRWPWAGWGGHAAPRGREGGRQGRPRPPAGTGPAPASPRGDLGRAPRPSPPRGRSFPPFSKKFIFFIYLFWPRKEFEALPARGGWGEEEEAALRAAPGLSLPKGAGGPVPVPVPPGGGEGGGGRGEVERGGRRPRRRGGDAAPGAVRPSCCWLRQPRRLPLCLSSPLILRTASPKACHSAKHSLLNRESEWGSGRGGERETARRSPVPQPSMASGDLYEVAGAAGREGGGGGAGRGAAEGSGGAFGSRSAEPS